MAERVVAALAATPKPCVVHFVGDAPRPADEARGLYFAHSLANAARLACHLAGLPGVPEPYPDPERFAALATRLPKGSALKALFCGGTTGQEALARLVDPRLPVRSNLHKKGVLRVDGIEPVPGNVLLDLGDDVFTRGRPHPMIEPALRNERLAIEMADPAAMLLLFDCVIGYGSHPDPAGVLAAGVEQARVQRPGLLAIASVTGTPEDPQDYHAQVRTLEAAGILVEPDNRLAAALAAAVLGGSR